MEYLETKATEAAPFVRQFVKTGENDGSSLKPLVSGSAFCGFRVHLEFRYSHGAYPLAP
jgi:hypothetical protein